ncbi:hypothetical protein GJ496_007894 [Pomphorhynchus laevis]|nr:hypothetical protein GJ496_007894 [Pomphorhynchus laevis]
MIPLHRVVIIIFTIIINTSADETDPNINIENDINLAEEIRTYLFELIGSIPPLNCSNLNSLNPLFYIIVDNTIIERDSSLILINLFLGVLQRSIVDVHMNATIKYIVTVNNHPIVVDDSNEIRFTDQEGNSKDLRIALRLLYHAFLSETLRKIPKSVIIITQISDDRANFNKTYRWEHTVLSAIKARAKVSVIDFELIYEKEASPFRLLQLFDLVDKTGRKPHTVLPDSNLNTNVTSDFDLIAKILPFKVSRVYKRILFSASQIHAIYDKSNLFRISESIIFADFYRRYQPIIMTSTSVPNDVNTQITETGDIFSTRDMTPTMYSSEEQVSHFNLSIFNSAIAMNLAEEHVGQYSFNPYLTNTSTEDTAQATYKSELSMKFPLNSHISRHTLSPKRQRDPSDIFEYTHPTIHATLSDISIKYVNEEITNNNTDNVSTTTEYSTSTSLNNIYSNDYTDEQTKFVSTSFVETLKPKNEFQNLLSMGLYGFDGIVGALRSTVCAVRLYHASCTHDYQCAINFHCEYENRRDGRCKCIKPGSIFLPSEQRCTGGFGSTCEMDLDCYHGMYCNTVSNPPMCDLNVEETSLCNVACTNDTDCAAIPGLRMFCSIRKVCVINHPSSNKDFSVYEYTDDRDLKSHDLKRTFYIAEALQLTNLKHMPSTNRIPLKLIVSYKIVISHSLIDDTL